MIRPSSLNNKSILENLYRILRMSLLLGDTENKDETEKQVAVNDEQKKKEINFEDMTPEQLQKMIDENQRIIENNERQIKEDIEKSKLIQRLLEQQQTIDAQQEEINRLRKLLETPQQ